MFVNYGDRNFFEYGLLVDEERAEKTNTHILYCRPFDDEENLYYFADCNVDITDSWINLEDVMSCCGDTADENNFIRLAIECIEYYGAENFSSPYNGYQFTKEEIKEMLKNYLIASDDVIIE